MLTMYSTFSIAILSFKMYNYFIVCTASEWIISRFMELYNLLLLLLYRLHIIHTGNIGQKHNSFISQYLNILL